MARGGGGAGGRLHSLALHEMIVAEAESATPTSLKPLSKAMASFRAEASVTVMEAVFQDEQGPPVQVTEKEPSGAGGATV